MPKTKHLIGIFEVHICSARSIVLPNRSGLCEGTRVALSKSVATGHMWLLTM